MPDIVTIVIGVQMSKFSVLLSAVNYYQMVTNTYEGIEIGEQLADDIDIAYENQEITFDEYTRLMKLM